MSLTVITPVLNEETFIPIFLESVTMFADEIIIVDGGSVDRTVEWIESYRDKANIRLYTHKQTGMPYSDDWNESEVRNFMVAKATSDWIANLDVDEIFDDRFAEVLPVLMEDKEMNVYQFPFVNFWRDLKTIRINAQGDARWSNDILRMWRNGIGIRYRDEKHHCTLQAAGGSSIWKEPRRSVSVPLYHYHYALGKRIKFGDNRRMDLGVLDSIGEPDFTYSHEHYEIRTAKFEGAHPTVIRNLIMSNNEQC
ncbi:glycosyltransferase involved in cell wall biosynthesis [Paenibacillus cellulosilyticus]|uniref:Glycosyltransferase involved in cell wall biosynthesis n=1 Tax=Paenibacillus cellulosilyticus TaxID=375489 RepID=A0A2V2Z2A5_9BACL|nr:glycosyltransferase [Paenibacillus cellulosilyticus]PWW02771.1 glycosyltransferase involved in cell wall biosynthesis [Paenibacillus cellulosilyticus]QKS45694.1 glycosyltransferase [Paenibacillus cellulosilyticus]